MGTSAAIGSVLPFCLSGKQPSASSVGFLAGGLLLTLLGIAVITKAGLMKEQAQKSGNTKLGIRLAVISGLCSGIMNVGFDKAAPLGKAAADSTAAAAVQWLPVLTGGMAASILCCTVLLFKRKHGILLPAKAQWAEAESFSLHLWYGWLHWHCMESLQKDRRCWQQHLLADFQRSGAGGQQSVGAKDRRMERRTKSKKVLLLGNIIIVASWLLTVQI